MKILAIELSTARGSLAWIDGDTRVIREWDNDRKNSGLFFENLSNVTSQFGLPQRIIVGLGPGSYAGVRIALSSAIGLKAASTAELVGYPSICALAGSEDDYAVVGDARRRSFYFARICQREIIGDIELLGPTDFKTQLDKVKLPLFSSDSLSEFGPIQLRYPSAQILGQLAGSDARQFLSHPLEPIYLREPHITISKAKVGGASL